jgi:hypothetical protein
MIRSSIPPIAYIDQVWFEKERKLFFEPLWQFATLKTLFKEENSYVALDVLGREVVIQTINGRGASVTSAKSGSIENRIAAVIVIIKTSVAKSKA